MANISVQFHYDITFWRSLYIEMTTHLNYIS